MYNFYLKNDIKHFLFYAKQFELASKLRCIYYYYGITTCRYFQSSFASLKTWISELKKHGSPNTIVAMAGNKSDMEDLREVQYRGKAIRPGRDKSVYLGQQITEQGTFDSKRIRI